MSEHTKELWHLSPKGRGFCVYDESGYRIAVPETADNGHRIVSDHNACLGIEDPAIAVPELVAACTDAKDLYDYLALGPFGSAATYGPDHDYKRISEERRLDTREALEAVLAKTGQPAASSADSAGT